MKPSIFKYIIFFNNKIIEKFELTSEEAFFAFQVMFKPEHPLMQEIQRTRKRCQQGEISCGKS